MKNQPRDSEKPRMSSRVKSSGGRTREGRQDQADGCGCMSSGRSPPGAHEGALLKPNHDEDACARSTVQHGDTWSSSGFMIPFLAMQQFASPSFLWHQRSMVSSNVTEIANVSQHGCNLHDHSPWTRDGR